MKADRARSRARSRVRRGLAALFVGAGAMHFVRPRPFEKMVPPGLPAPRRLVALSGAAEVAGGLGLLVPRTRRAAGWGLAALLVAVFPANVYAALEPARFAWLAPPWALRARLPVQPALVWLVGWASGAWGRR